VPDERNVLAVDTASPAPGVALLARGETVEENLPPNRQASEELLPAIRRCLARSGLSLEHVSHLAVCAGPGSFTGLRVGLATAWGLSRAAGIPVEIVSTLEAMAEAWRAVSHGPVWTALDAGRGEVAFQEFGLEGPRAEARRPAMRLSRAEAARRVGTDDQATLPRDLLAPEGRALPRSPAHALALAVARAPRPATSGAFRAIYARTSAAEEKHGPA
jgi:tRNA threonylcarbamoyl adenosine modification protein YeaZ